jgi:D-galactarolactone cycloisomerase
VFRCPIETPVVTSFGVMRDRPMVLVRVEDTDGAAGWGEIWCNFPAVGAEHRARLVDSVLAPLVEGVALENPPAAWDAMTAKTEVLAIQSGEQGPIAQAIAGVDIALWDLAARKAGLPLWRMLGGNSPRVRVYASGLNPDAPERLAVIRQRAGHRAFKLKIGFGVERDLANLAALRAALGNDAVLMVDANQAWTLEEALAVAPRLAAFDLKWLEEPLRANRPWSEWISLASRVPIPLAAGENLAGAAMFEQALRANALGVVQPDIAKWGGFSGCAAVAKKILATGARFCPHYLGGGIGLLASAHLLAAIGGNGLLEIDANDNPLRTLTCGPLSDITQGEAVLADAPGLGAIPDLSALGRYSISPG